MALFPLLTGMRRDPGFARLASHPAQDLRIVAPPTLNPLIVAELAQTEGLVVAVTATNRESEDLLAALSDFLGADAVAEFPSWETLPHERLSPAADIVGVRIAALRRIKHPEVGRPLSVVVCPVRALLQPLVTGLADLEPVRLLAKQEIAFDDAVQQLAAAGYARVDIVEKRGQFAVRGGLLDVFPPTEEHPLRVEFWGDEVDDIRYFAVADQRSLGQAEQGLWAPPCRELLLTEEVRRRARQLMATYPQVADVLDKAAEGVYVEGMESLSPVLASGLETFIDLLPSDSLLLSCDPERIRARAHDLVATSEEFLEASWQNAALGNVTPIDLGAAAYRDFDELRAIASARELKWWSSTPFAFEPEDELALSSGIDAIAIDARAIEPYRGDGEKVAQDIRGALALGQRVVLVADGQGSAKRLVETLANADIPAKVDKSLREVPEMGVVEVVAGQLAHGFTAPAAGLAVISEQDIVRRTGSTRDMRRMPSRRKRIIDPLSLKPGDYVVHETHGVGKYLEMTQRVIGGATREYVVIEYAPSKKNQPGDRLYVPSDQLDLITRYIGGETPSVHRLGGADWAQTKTRAKKAVRQIANELIRLYAARQAAPGYAFSADTVWQRELEDAFPYTETPDQLQVIDEVKRDMEKSVPMDRVICGDVGYGKTEIAVRAVFKAVQEGKQVAVLVPTTLLVQQHMNTFTERFAQFPITVAALSRFESDAEVKATMTGMLDGSIDVVIGTHRLFSKEIRFKDLGLVVVDEEQRFGVEHKEHLKALRTNVDVLTMTATPIPRTLEMSLTGIREMSTITTPPEDRHPILTYVGPADSKQIAAAIRRELLREGQVFYVHNRVESIQRQASKLAELVPEARIAVAHGQMHEHALEQVIMDFWERRFDVLVSTTIVESGLNIPNANTLIVDRAEAFGLSQLHQLRGRVGRGRERAYAYFLYPPEKPLSETAYDRLSTIAQHTDLGAGIQVAMKDLEIRGAGNLLGGEQSGHIADVGFDLYVRLVGEALAEYKGDTDSEPVDVKVELPLDAHLPHEYVPSERLRLDLYKRLADAHDEASIAAMREEIADRYGALPAPVETLLEVARLRTEARDAGIHEIVLAGSVVRFAPVELPESRSLRMNRLYPRSSMKPATRTLLIPRPMTASLGGQPLANLELLQWVREVLRAMTAPIA